MAVLKEYRCLAHGPFEGYEAVCPHGCSTVMQEFRTAPGMRSDATRAVDQNLESLAKRFGLTDMNNRGGDSVGHRQALSAPAGMTPTWGAMPKGNVFEAGKGEVAVEGAQGGAVAALDSMGMGQNAQLAAMESAHGALPTFADMTSGLTPPKPVVSASFGGAAELSAAVESAS